MKTLKYILGIQEMKAHEMRTQNGGCTEDSLVGMIENFYNGGMKEKKLQTGIIKCIKKIYGIDATSSDF